MKIIFCGGGTAGHINPSLSVADGLKGQKNEIIFVSREGGGENSLISDEGYKLITYKVKGLSRSPAKALSAILLAKKARRQAIDILKTESPDIVFGTGGYVSFPLLSAAIKLKIPTVLHESNITAGMVTRLLSGKCTKLLIPEGCKIKAKDNALTVGTPIRKRFSEYERNRARRELSLTDKDIFILSLGGSLGAKKLNDTVIPLMLRLTKDRRRIRWIHSVGNRYYGEISQKYPELCESKSAKVVPYITDMPKYLTAADIVISRCGAVSIAEITETMTPAILIPSPNVTDDHQRKNAERLMNSGQALVIDESNLTEETLLKNLSALIDSKETRERMRKAFLKDIKQNPREKICELLYSLTTN